MSDASTMILVCPKCKKGFELPKGTKIICGCGTVSEAEPPPEPCRSCKHRHGSLCEFYVRRCSLRKLWSGEIDPPERCPHRDLLEID